MIMAKITTINNNDSSNNTNINKNNYNDNNGNNNNNNRSRQCNSDWGRWGGQGLQKSKIGWAIVDCRMLWRGPLAGHHSMSP